MLLIHPSFIYNFSCKQYLIAYNGHVKNVNANGSNRNEIKIMAAHIYDFN